MSQNGYARVRVGVDGKWKTIHVHRLIALAFIPKPEGIKTEVNHKDRNKLNNAVTNLEWVTHSENIRKARAIKPWQTGSRIGRAVVVQDIDGLKPRRYASIAGAAKGEGVPTSNIHFACTHRRWYARRWYFAGQLPVDLGAVRLALPLSSSPTLAHARAQAGAGTRLTGTGTPAPPCGDGVPSLTPLLFPRDWGVKFF